jgi:DNA-binding transcriptional LysR family regulator
VTPTPFGARILPLIATAITSLDTITAEARRLTAPTEPKVRMGVSPLISSAVIARAFSAVCTLSSKRDLVLREADMDELRSSLLAQELDVILIPAVAPMPRFEHRTIEIEPMVVVDREEQGPGDGGPADPEAAEVFELAEAHREQFILVPDTCGLTRFTSNLFTENDLPLQTYTGKPSNYRALEEWVALGLGLAILPAPKLTSPAVPHRTLVNQGRPVTISYEAVWSTTSPLAGDLETLVTGMLEAAPSLSGPTPAASR